MSYEFEMPTQQGWVCPQFGRVYAPWMSMCDYCGNNNVMITDNTKPFLSTIDLLGKEHKDEEK